MSLETNISDLATAIATELKKTRVLLNNNAVDLSALTTSSKTNLVAAINEVAAAIGEAGASIDDDNISTLTVWSSDKTDSEIDIRISNIVDAAPGALNTLNELAAALGDDPSFATTMTNALAAKVAGPASASADRIASFDGTTGKLIKDSGILTSEIVKTSGDQTIGGTKTYTTAPAIPDSSYAIAKIIGLQAALDAKAAASHTHSSSAITDFSTAVPAAVPAATTGAAGKVELSTNAEAIAGTDTERAVTPANLAAVVGNSTTDFVATFEAGLA